MPRKTVTTVLVVWNEILDNVSFVVQQVDPGTLERMKRWHNCFINAGDTPAEVQDEIWNAFYTSEGEFRFTKERDPITNKKFDLVICTGIFG